MPGRLFPDYTPQGRLSISHIEGLRAELDDHNDRIADTVENHGRAFVATNELTTSTGFTDLTTTTDTVTLTTGTSVLIILTAALYNNTAGQASIMSVDISGASSISASDQRALYYEDSGPNAPIRASAVVWTNSLTAGSNTFKLKYRVTGGSGRFLNREITVIPLG